MSSAFSSVQSALRIAPRRGGGDQLATPTMSAPQWHAGWGVKEKGEDALLAVKYAAPEQAGPPVDPVKELRRHRIVSIGIGHQADERDRPAEGGRSHASERRHKRKDHQWRAIYAANVTGRVGHPPES